MKTIVFLSNGEKHSAWLNKDEAIKQIKILKEYGYRNCYFEYIEHNYSNGYYFV